MPRSSTYADNVARWNAIPLTPNASVGMKRSRSRSRSGSTTPPPVIKLQGDPDSSDDDNTSLISRSISPQPENLVSYNEHHIAPEKETITVDTKIKSTNKGYALLTKLGWSDGQPLGLSKDGRIEPIPFSVKNDLTGLGKRAQDERMIETTVSQRRELVSERQIRETLEERQSREQKAAEKEALANQIATTLRAFYCSLCDKQYQTVAQYDEHTNSYAHHHKQRFKDMQAHAKGLGSTKLDRDTRLEKERKREEKELRRMAKARGVKVTPVNVPLSQKVEPQPSSSSMSSDASKGFKTSGWATVSKQNSNKWATVGSSSAFSAVAAVPPVSPSINQPPHPLSTPPPPPLAALPLPPKRSPPPLPSSPPPPPPTSGY